MFTLTGFTDEAAVSLRGQLKLAQRAGLSYFEFRRINSHGLGRIDEADAPGMKRHMDAAGVHVSCMASRVGKTSITEPLDEDLALLRKCARLAHVFDTRYVRVFSYKVEKLDPDRHRDQVLERMARFVDIAEAEDVILLHENEKSLYGTIPNRIADLVQTLGSPRLRLIFDPANFVQCGVSPLDAYARLREWVSYLHIKDADSVTGRVRPAGRADSQLPELIRELMRDGFDGFLSIEPHLGLGGRGAPSSPKKWKSAVDALTGILDAEGVDWS